jgi:hypothetical protein
VADEGGASLAAFAAAACHRAQPSIQLVLAAVSNGVSGGVHALLTASAYVAAITAPDSDEPMLFSLLPYAYTPSYSSQEDGPDALPYPIDLLIQT